MKKIPFLPAVLAVTLLLGATAALRAGPPPDLQIRMRPAIHQPATTDTTAKADKNRIPTVCAQMPNCGCAAMAAQKAKS